MASMLLKELLKAQGLEVTSEDEEVKEKKASEARRTKQIVERPDEEVTLQSLCEEVKEVVKTQKDPTDDLVALPRTFKAKASVILEMGAGYVVQDKDTGECWYAHDKHCLDANFVYRLDLNIWEVADAEEASAAYAEAMKDVDTGLIPCQTKYILDDPGNETYEVYADSNYPSMHYGKATPTGMFVHRYPNRFHRDMAILNLDKLYTESSAKQAAKMTAKQLKPHEAIVISDGAWMKDTSCYSYFYLDNTSVLKQTEGVIPSEPDQAVLISEINGAYYALMQCYMRKKKRITYYYDNTSILNVFKNRKTEYIEEIKRYKDFCEKLLTEGYQVTYVELHPKTDEEKDKLNRALTFFHNTCDSECRKMADIFKKDYKTYAGVAEADGKTFATVKAETKPKGKPKQNRR